MTPRAALIEALRLLCTREGGPERVADAIRCNPQTLKQILTGTLLPSGQPRGVGPQLQRNLEAKFPGWAKLAVAQLGSAPAGPALRWPFRLITAEQWDGLDDSVRGAAEMAALEAIDRWTAIEAANKRRPG